MADRRVDASKMYAHVYFDLKVSAGAFGIAIYSVARIPGFAGKPSPAVEEKYPGMPTANELFLRALQSGDNPIKMSPEDLQTGKLFFYQEVEDKIPEIDARGKAQVEDPEAQVVVDLDNPIFWISSILYRLKDMDDEQIKSMANDVKQKEFDSVISEPVNAYFTAAQNLQTNPSDEAKKEFVAAKRGLESTLQRLYLIVSRITNPKTGGKSYPKRAHPPTMIASKEYNIAYYPGFRGSPYMSETPGSTTETGTSESTYKHKEEPGKYWHQILIPNVNEIIDPHKITEVRVEVLDQIAEIGARLFYRGIRKSPTPSNELKFADFSQAALPVINKTRELLALIDNEDLKEGYQKTASSFVGVWIDLANGQIYATLPELLSAKQSQTQELAKAAGVVEVITVE